MGCAQSAEKAGGKEQPPAEKWDADSAKAFLPAQLLVPAEKQCTAVVNICVRCNNVAEGDEASSSGAYFAELSISNQGEWRELGRTETLDGPSPDFKTVFQAPFFFTQLQRLRVVLHRTSLGSEESASKKDSCIAGTAEFQLPEVLAHAAEGLKRPLEGGSTEAVCALRAQEAPSHSATVTLRFAASKLAGGGGGGAKPNAFLMISRQEEDGSDWIPVYRSEVRPDTRSPEWDEIRLTGAQLYGADASRRIRLEVLHASSSGRGSVLGEAHTTISNLVTAGSSNSNLPIYPQTIPATPSSAPGSASGGSGVRAAGRIIVRSASHNRPPSFLDFIANGVELGFMVGIDFTYGNRDPHDPSSLHSPAESSGMTPYEGAVAALGRILSCYDRSQLISVWGFGGRLGESSVSHCVALNGNGFRPEVRGVAGVLGVYKSALLSITQSGPRLISQLVAAAAFRAQQEGEQRNAFSVLAILTAGPINDCREALAVLTANPSEPIPIAVAILGVGNADFTSLEEDVRFCQDKLSGRLHFSKLVDPTPANYDAVTDALIGCIPGQLLAGFQKKGITPEHASPQNAARMNGSS